jgi:hypothetical protein
MNHDITHCNNKSCKLHKDCYRYVALKALKKENSKLPEEQQTHCVSMFLDTNENCIKQYYKYFMEL